ncbi:MAG: FtsX-like permease family protein [Pseudoflavonifractor sp.]|nr:FtsX-like permease family protein [Alloprevotella sp.]MCM1116013.1 FtsX-like permease family protein [Pseudoflavonifractor sp.]
MNIAVYIGKRLSFNTRGDEGSGHRHRHGSAGVPIAVGGIALALVVMMVSIAVMTGFKEEIRAKVTGFNSQVTIYPQSRTLAEVSSIPFSTELNQLIEDNVPAGVRVDAVVELPGILKTDSAFQGVMVKALEPGARGLSFIEDNLIAGQLPADRPMGPDSIMAPPEILISSTNASRLGLKEGDKADLHFITHGDLMTRRAIVSGIYDTNLGEYDSRFVFATPTMARKAGKIADGEVTSIELNGLTDEEIDPISGTLASALLEYAAGAGGGQASYYSVDNIHRSGMAYFSWLDLLDTNVAVILILMALVSGFTLISSLFIIILERVNTIGTLKALGATNGQIRGIFIYMAERLVARGLVIGNAIALAIILIQAHFHLIPLDAEAYFLSHVPMKISWLAVAGLNVATVAVSAIILILPSHIVATLSPASSIRYE